MSQLALPLQLSDHAVFASFLAEGNEALFATLSDFTHAIAGPGCWIWGVPACGKSHLLQAVCERAGDAAIYLPMQQLAAYDAALLTGLESRAIVCLDDINVVLGDDVWEQALFALANQLFDNDGQLLIAASSAPREASVALPDLASRFSRLTTFQVHELDDDQRVRALQLRSEHRGLELPLESARYLMRRSRRDMASLYELLDRLDNAALQAKRRLTVPFVREVIEGGKRL